MSSPNIHLLTNAKVLGPFLKEGIDNLLGLLLLDYSRGRCHLLALGLLSFRLQIRNITILLLPPTLAYLQELSVHLGNAFSHALHHPGLALPESKPFAVTLRPMNLPEQDAV